MQKISDSDLKIAYSLMYLIINYTSDRRIIVVNCKDRIILRVITALNFQNLKLFNISEMDFSKKEPRLIINKSKIDVNIINLNFSMSDKNILNFKITSTYSESLMEYVFDFSHDLPEIRKRIIETY